MVQIPFTPIVDVKKKIQYIGKVLEVRINNFGFAIE